MQRIRMKGAKLQQDLTQTLVTSKNRKKTKENDRSTRLQY